MEQGGEIEIKRVVPVLKKRVKVTVPVKNNRNKEEKR